MSRLIDADALIEAINRSTCNWTEYLWKQVVRDVVNNQPTAYDVEKVVADIEEFYEEAEHYGFASALSDIVEVVKRGGVE